jgi:hypothetical protein
MTRPRQALSSSVPSLLSVLFFLSGSVASIWVPSVRIVPARGGQEAGLGVMGSQGLRGYRDVMVYGGPVVYKGSKGSLE